MKLSVALAVGIGVVAVVVGACTTPAPGVADAQPIRTIDATAPAAPPRTDGPCPGSASLTGDLEPDPDVTAVSIDREHVQIVNHSARTLYFRLAAYEPTQLESCRDLVELEIVRGPIGAGASFSTDLGPAIGRPGLPLLLSLWDRPCGEGCDRPPFSAMVVPRSPLEPAAS